MITVPITSSHYFHDDHAYSEGWWLDDKVYEWLLQHVGSGSQAGGCRDGDVWGWAFTVHGNQPQSNVIWFKDPKHAVFFKLTWG